MKSFNETKEYIVTEAEKKQACASQLRRARNAEDVNDLLIVVKENLSWVAGNNLFNGITISDFFTDEQLIEHGLYNSGEGNSGFSNTGYSNTGDSNTGYSNTGAFCTGDPGFPMFNKPSDWTEQDFRNSLAYELLCEVDTKQWVPSYAMSEEEKKANPSHETCEGYLKDIPFKQAFQEAWDNWGEKDRAAFTSLPNFDPEIFKEITGVDVKGGQK